MSALENTVVDNLTPSEFYLCKNFPDPFREKTTIKFCVPYKTNVKLEVLDTQNNMIKVLIDEEKEAGTYETEFSAGSIPEGFYVYRIEAGEYNVSRMFLLFK